MRRLNSTINVDFISEKGFDNTDKTYFAYIPLENMICYAVAESCDNYSNENSAEIAVKSALAAFERKPSFKNLKQYIRKAHYALREKRLEASIIIVVSDYTRIRYASCGNVKFYLLNNEAIELESEVHYFIYEDNNSPKYSHEKESIHEPRNLSQYLGQSKPIKPFVSKKIELPEGCTMLFATVNIWEALDDVEILDAYANSDNFVDCIQALYIPTEHEASAIGSYSIVSLFVEKPFKEDNIKKKKRRRIIIFSIVIAVILAIISAIIYYLDRRAITKIRDLDSKSIEYLYYGKYDTVFEQYDEASTRTNALRLKWLHKEEKNVLIETVPQMKELIYYIVKGDEELDNGNYEDAYSFYMQAKELSFKLGKDKDTEENLKFAPKMYDMLGQIEIYINARLEKTEKYVAVIRLIKEASNIIAYEGKYLDAASKCKEAERAVVSIDNLEHRDNLKEKINEEKQKIILWVDARELKATEKITDGDFDGAVLIYEEMMLNYAEIGEISKAAEIQEKIYDVVGERKSLDNEITIELAEAYIKSGDEFFGANNFNGAIVQYNLAKDLYVKLKMKDNVTVVNEKISEVQAKNVEVEHLGSVLAAQVIENDGDVLLGVGDYDGAIVQYNLAKNLYINLKMNDGVTIVNGKINEAQTKKAEMELLGNVLAAQILVDDGDVLLSSGDYDGAIGKYNLAKDSYLNLKMKDDVTMVNEKISAAQAKKAETELLGNVLAVQVLEDDGDVLLSKGNYNAAREQYRQAQAAYQALNLMDKATAVQDKIRGADDMEAMEQAGIAENEKKRFVAEGQYLEQEGYNFEQDGDFKNAIKSYSKAWELYLSANDVDKALAVLMKLREAERKEKMPPVEEAAQVGEIKEVAEVGEVEADVDAQ